MGEAEATGGLEATLAALLSDGRERRRELGEARELDGGARSVFGGDERAGRVGEGGREPRKRRRVGRRFGETPAHRALVDREARPRVGEREIAGDPLLEHLARPPQERVAERHVGEREGSFVELAERAEGGDQTVAGERIEGLDALPRLRRAARVAEVDDALVRAHHPTIEIEEVDERGLVHARGRLTVHRRAIAALGQVSDDDALGLGEHAEPLVDGGGERFAAERETE